MSIRRQLSMKRTDNEEEEEAGKKNVITMIMCVWIECLWMTVCDCCLFWVCRFDRDIGHGYGWLRKNSINNNKNIDCYDTFP